MYNEHTYLYVEDDPMSREIMEMIMRNGMGIERLYVLENSRDFSDRLATFEERPDIILLDIHMHPYSGFEILDMLRADPQYEKARVVALTASVMNEEVEQLKSAGFDGTIAKPLSIMVFPALMARIIAGESVWHIT